MKKRSQPHPQMRLASFLYYIILLVLFFSTVFEYHIIGTAVPYNWYWSFIQLVLQFILTGTAVYIDWYWI